MNFAFYKIKMVAKSFIKPQIIPHKMTRSFNLPLRVKSNDPEFVADHPVCIVLPRAMIAVVPITRIH